MGDQKERILARRTLLMMAAAAAACRRSNAEVDSGVDHLNTPPTPCLSVGAPSDEERARLQAELDEQARIQAERDRRKYGPLHVWDAGDAARDSAKK